MRVLFATIGSLGDLHPCLAVALGLRARGHSVAIATNSVHRARVEAEQGLRAGDRCAGLCVSAGRDCLC